MTPRRCAGFEKETNGIGHAEVTKVRAGPFRCDRNGLPVTEKDEDDLAAVSNHGSPF
jgi:hypothetical protein